MQHAQCGYRHTKREKPAPSQAHGTPPAVSMHRIHPQYHSSTKSCIARSRNFSRFERCEIFSRCEAQTQTRTAPSEECTNSSSANQSHKVKHRSDPGKISRRPSVVEKHKSSSHRKREFRGRDQAGKAQKQHGLSFSSELRSVLANQCKSEQACCFSLNL